MMFDNKKEFKDFISSMKLEKKELVEIKVPRTKQGALLASEIQEKLIGTCDFVIGFKDE